MLTPTDLYSEEELFEMALAELEAAQESGSKCPYNTAVAALSQRMLDEGVAPYEDESIEDAIEDAEEFLDSRER